MVVLFVDDHLKTKLVGPFHEFNQSSGPAIGLIFDCSRARLVVGPARRPAREIDRHQLQRGNAFAGETGQSTCGGREVAFSGEGPDMQFIDHALPRFQRARAVWMKVGGPDSILQANDEI